MKYLCLIILSLSAGITYSQKHKYTRELSSWDLTCTSKFLSGSPFSSSINTSKHFQIGQPFNYIGISLTSQFIINRPNSWINRYLHGYLEYAQIIPQSIHINDSMQAKVNGFNMALVILGYDFIKSTRLDLKVCFGLNLGSVYLCGNKNTRQKNPGVAPLLVFNPRIFLGRVSIQGRIVYDYDLTNPDWKKRWFTKEPQTTIPEFRNSGLSISFGIGYQLR